MSFSKLNIPNDLNSIVFYDMLNDVGNKSDIHSFCIIISILEKHQRLREDGVSMQCKEKIVTGAELSRDLFSLEEQITAQMYVWAASIGIDSEVLDEARFEDSTEDIMTPEQHEIYTGFDFTIGNLIHDGVELGGLRRMDEPVSIFDIDSLHEGLLFFQAQVPADIIEDIVAKFNPLLRWYSVPFGGLDAVLTEAENVRQEAMRSWLG